MDRNQVIGIVLIAAILIGYSIFSSPSKEEIEAVKTEESMNDTSKTAGQEKDTIDLTQLTNQKNQTVIKTKSETSDTLLNDTTLKQQFGPFYESATGHNKFITLENDLIKLTISTKGGKPYSVQLKNYIRFDSLPVILFDGDKNNFGLNFNLNIQHKLYSVPTNELFFTTMDKDSIVIVQSGKKSVKLRLYAGDNTYIEYTYSLEPQKYLVDFDINLVGLNRFVSLNEGPIKMNWNVEAPAIEKGKAWEDQYTGIYFKHLYGDVDYLSETSSKDEESVSTSIKWIAFKQQFFASILIAKDSIKGVKIDQLKIESDPAFLKQFNASFSIPFNGKDNETVSFAIYYGPNQYKILNNIHVKKDDELQLTKLIPLGWGIFGWINKFAIIPLFNWLGGFISNFGLLILLMTIIIKAVLFPLTFKSYISSAKMRVLKPQIDEINAKIPKDKALERQQSTMALYKKAGVNPMGGCIPMLLQFPILIAMYRFFPASIELRQKAFLWTNDLSSYDSIFSWTTNIPLISSFYGNHVSLFTLLMAISMIFSTKMAGNQMQGSNPQMPGMKMMIYMMPVMMILWFNNYSSGLSYYYFLTNIITIAQTLIIRRFVDDEEVLMKLNENKKKPVVKSKFQQRLEEMTKQRTQQKPKRK
jgi:YidC/Oxa1 family membrane protein insertase